jgi:hypothetical protein
MIEKYKIEIGTDERQIPGTLISYECQRNGQIFDRPFCEDDSELIDKLRRMKESLDIKRLKVELEIER